MQSVNSNHTLEFTEFSNLRELIREKLGIYLGDNKVSFLEKRIKQRLAFLEVESFKEYYHYLRFADADGFELQALTDLITTNETYMFREFEQLEAFANHCLPEVYHRKKEKNEKTLKIWSAGCSTGEEPYTIAIILREILEDHDDWDIQITATDIDSTVLNKSREGLYSDRSVKHVPQEYYSRHFSTVEKGHKIHPETQRLVNFKHLNLHDRRAMRRHRGFDFIFCRNVLIYFDDAARKAVVDNFYTALQDGGFIFLGHSESVGRISGAFHLRHLDHHLVYSKNIIK